MSKLGILNFLTNSNSDKQSTTAPTKAATKPGWKIRSKPNYKAILFPLCGMSGGK